VLHTKHPLSGPISIDQQKSRVVQWVCDVMRAELNSGAYPNNVLPSEDALITKYSVSRGTIRRVLTMLREQGVIERVRGAGTFVMSRGLIVHDIGQSRDIAQDVNAQAPRVSIMATHVSSRPAIEFIARSLGIETGAEVIIIESLTSLDGFPLSLRSAFMPADIFAEIMLPGFDVDRSPYEIINDVLREPVGATELHISSSIADSTAGELLGVPVGFPLLDTARVIRTLDGRAVEYSVSHLRGDRVVFSTLMQTADAAPNAHLHGDTLFNRSGRRSPSAAVR